MSLLRRASSSEKRRKRMLNMKKLIDLGSARFNNCLERLCREGREPVMLHPGKLAGLLVGGCYLRREHSYGARPKVYRRKRQSNGGIRSEWTNGRRPERRPNALNRHTGRNLQNQLRRHRHCEPCSHVIAGCRDKPGGHRPCACRYHLVWDFSAAQSALARASIYKGWNAQPYRVNATR
jgi:hypothetical protein